MTVPSPLATGGSGHDYERRVGAMYLATLLVGGKMPFWPQADLQKIHFQARHLGWATDDFVLVGEHRGARRRVAVQAKRSFTLRLSDEECVKTLRAAWNDFSNATMFDPTQDRIALVTGEAPRDFHRGLRSLLDAAHAAPDAADFARRLTLAESVSSVALRYHETVATILGAHAQVSGDRIWSFLRVWDFAVLDLQAASSPVEALVKSMLSAAAVQTESTNEIWEALLNLAASEAGRARTFDWGNLPPDLRDQCKSPASDHQTFEKVHRLSSVVREGVTDRIARVVALPRAQVVADAGALLGETDAVVVTGPAGVGKSVIAAKLFDLADRRTLALAFRADSLATPHLATSALQVGLDLSSLVRLFGAHQQRLLWIESAERLLEKAGPEREAFLDLLRMLRGEHGWKLLVTCRDYATERFRAAFLSHLGIDSAVFAVPLLSDIELNAVAKELPALQAPLNEPRMTKVLRNPLFLSIAARMTWGDDAPTATTHRAFRDRAWDEVVCCSVEENNGMPLERDRAMVEIAQRRAPALVPFVDSGQVNAAALSGLTRDSLLVRDPGDHSKYAPAHDVFEDWALLQWLQRTHDNVGGLNASFFAALGTHPAFRRAFRIWLLERADAAPEEVALGVQALMGNKELDAHWREDTLVAVLQSSGADEVLARLGPHFKRDIALLKQAVHLLHVACRAVPFQRAISDGMPPVRVPVGLAWQLLPRFLVESLGSFKVTDIFWLLEFAEDFVVRARTQASPRGASEVFQVAGTLLACSKHVGKDYHDAYVDRVLRVLLAIPRASESSIRALVGEALTRSRDGWSKGHILTLVWSHFAGEPLCREFPDLVLQVLQERLRHRVRLDSDPRAYSGRMEVADAFGLGHLSDFDHSPASAWQGPILNLLTHHPSQGVDFVLRFINESCSSLARAPQGIVEPLGEIELTLLDGKIHRQLANDFLWRLYRATSVGPNTIQSALMAVEAWLLAKAERGDEDLEVVFGCLLQGSNNVATTAVLASIAVSSPYLVAEAALPLLTCPALFGFDSMRWTHDRSHHAVGLVGYSMERDPEKKSMEEERVSSAKRLHRGLHLEQLAVSLQLTAAHAKVWEILDRYGANLPRAEAQTEEDRIWRLRLHRMDVRKLVPTGERVDGRVVLQPRPPSADLVAFQERERPAHEEHARRTELYLWGSAVFEGREPEKFHPGDWYKKLKLVRELRDEDASELDLLLDRSGEPQIAGVCMRDHWDEMSEEERTWCANAVCGAVEDAIGAGSTFASLALSGASPGIRAAAEGVGLVIARSSDSGLRARAKRCLAAALMQRERPVNQSAANGIGEHLYHVDSGVAHAAAQALVTWARDLGAYLERVRTAPPALGRRDDEFEAALRSRVEREFEDKEPLDEGALFSIDYLREPGCGALIRLLGIFGKGYDDPLAQRFHVHVAEVLVAAWQVDGDQGRRSRRHDDETVALRFTERRNVRFALARFALACPENIADAIMAPLCAATGNHIVDAADLVEDLIRAEDVQFTPTRFWHLWRRFADELLRLEAAETSAKRATLSPLIRAVFLDIEWKKEAHEWRTLNGHGPQVIELFEKMAPSPATVRCFAVLADRFRQELIPRALPVLAQKLQVMPERMFIADAAVSALENILASLVDSGSSDIRRVPALRNATLSLLDMLVEMGSSAAFGLRDDFLTPLRY